MAREISEGCNGWPWFNGWPSMMLTIPPQQKVEVCIFQGYQVFTGWWFQISFFNGHPYLGKISNLTNIFQLGWNNQPVLCLPLLFPTLPNGGQVGDIGKVWCSLFSIGWEVVASRGRCFFPNRLLLFVFWRMLIFNSFFVSESLFRRDCMFCSPFLREEKPVPWNILLRQMEIPVVFLQGSFCQKAGTFGVNEYSCVFVGKKNIMGIVEKISSCVLNMDSSGRGGWVVKIALDWLSQEVIKVGFMLHPATENCWWICWPPNMVNRIGVTVAYAICVQAYFSVLRVSIAILLCGERNHGKRCEIRSALGRLGCLQGRDWDSTCI